MPRDVYSGFRYFSLPRDRREANEQVSVTCSDVKVWLVSGNYQLEIVLSSRIEAETVLREVVMRLVPFSLLLDGGPGGNAPRCLREVRGESFPKELERLKTQILQHPTLGDTTKGIVDFAAHLVHDDTFKNALGATCVAVSVLFGIVGFGLFVYRSLRDLQKYQNSADELEYFYELFDDFLRNGIMYDGKMSSLTDRKSLSLFDDLIAAMEDVTGKLLYTMGSKWRRLTTPTEVLTEETKICRFRLQDLQGILQQRFQNTILDRSSSGSFASCLLPRRALVRQTIGHRDHVARKVENQLVCELMRQIHEDGPWLLKVCLWGMPQSGKSTLAYNVAQRLGEHFPDQVVLEMDGYVESGPAKSMNTAIREFMQAREEGITDQNCFPKFCKSLSTKFPSVVLIEDVNERQISEVAGIDFGFPTRALVIVTTRDASVKTRAEHAGFLCDWNINHLEDEEVFAVFEAVRQSKSPNLSSDDLRTWIKSNRLLCVFPSIGWVKHIAHLIMKYTSLHDMETAVSTLKSKVRPGESATMEPGEIISWTLARMQSLGRTAEIEALLTVALFRGSFDARTFQNSADLDSYADACSHLASLEEWGFVVRQHSRETYDPEAGDFQGGQTRWWMHPELRSVTRSVLNEDPATAATENKRQRKLSNCYLALAASLSERQTSPRIRARAFAIERDNIAFALNVVGSRFFSTDTSRFWRLWSENVMRHSELKSILRREMAELAHSNDSNARDSYARLGMCLVALLESLGNYSAALQMGENIRQHWTETERTESRDCADLDLRIGDVLRTLNRFSEALARYEGAICVYWKLGLRDSVNCAHAILGSGQVFRGLSHYSAALSRFEEAIGIYRKIGLADSVTCALATQGSGNALRRLGRKHEALRCFEDAIGVYRKLGLGNTVNCANAIRGSGKVLRDLGRYAEALRRYDTGIEIYLKHHLDESENSAIVIGEKGSLLAAMGYRERGILALRRSIEIYDFLGLENSKNCRIGRKQLNSALNCEALQANIS